jgi:hypothetical protein
VDVKKNIYNYRDVIYSCEIRGNSLGPTEAAGLSAGLS